MPITIPNTFTTGTTIVAADVNTNFTELGSKALNRAGDNISGNITVDAAITIDGRDISADLDQHVLTTSTPTFAGVTISGTGASALDVGGGINAGTGNVGIVDTTGKIPALSSTYFASLSGANITAIAEANITDGTVLGRLGSVETWTAAGTHTWSASTNGANTLNVRNTSNGSSAYAGLRLGNDASATVLTLQANSTTNSGGAGGADGVGIVAGAGDDRNLVIKAESISLTVTDEGNAPSEGAVSITNNGEAFLRMNIPGFINLVPVFASPTPTSGAAVYVTNNRLVFQYVDGVTTRYKYLTLTGTGVTWVHTTSAP